MRQDLYKGRLATLSAGAPLFATRPPAHPLFCHSTMNRFGSLIPTRFTGDSTAPNSSRWRSAASTSVVVPARKPVRRPPRSRTARGRDQSRASDAQASLKNRAIAVPARPGYRSVPPGISQPDEPRTGPRVSFTPSARRPRLDTSRAEAPPATQHRARRAARPRALRPRRVRPARSAPAGYGPRSNVNVIASPSGPAARRMVAGPAPPDPRCPRGRGHRHRSPDTSPVAAIARRSRTASGSPGTPSPPSDDAPDSPPEDAPPALGCRSPLHRHALNVHCARARAPPPAAPWRSRPRTSSSARRR